MSHRASALRRTTLLSALLALGGCLPIFGPCSGPRLDDEEFCALPPAEQVQEWRRLYGGEVSLGHGQHFRFLDCIIENGCAGADAVVPLLRETQKPFLVEDAIHVVRFVHLQHCNLKDHEALEALREVERSQIDPEIRERAREAIQLIETTVPSSPSEDARPPGTRGAGPSVHQ